MDFKKGGYYKYTESNGTRWLVLCMYVDGDKTALRLAAFDDKVVEITKKDMRGIIRSGSTFKLLHDKSEVARILLNGF